jgi:hypothetical protein
MIFKKNKCRWLPFLENAVDRLDKMKLPPQDRRIIGTFHYYKPLQFTHQGAAWVKDSAPWRGTRWTGTSRRNGRSSATILSAPPDGPNKTAARSTLENLVPIERQTWTIGRCGCGL